jgi:hypothetical protein
MSDKSNLFFKAFAGKKAKMPPLDHFAEGGMSEEKPSEVEASEGGDTDVSPEEKVAAYEVGEAVKGGDPTTLAKALKAFFLIVDSQPHEEGGAGAEPMPPNPGGSPFG